MLILHLNLSELVKIFPALMSTKSSILFPSGTSGSRTESERSVRVLGLRRSSVTNKIEELFLPAG